MAVHACVWCEAIPAAGPWRCVWCAVSYLIPKVLVSAVSGVEQMIYLPEEAELR
jgi:hypothetical protein